MGRRDGSLMDYHLIGEEYQNFNDTDNVFVIAKKLPNEKKLKNGEYYLIDGEAYDNKKEDFVYVKGKELKEALEERGVSLTAYTR